MGAINERVVIIGGGQAGIQLADSLRAQGYQGEISIVDDDRALPYQRPPLSKDFLTQGPAPEPLPLRAASFFAEQNIELRSGLTVLSVDTVRRSVALSDGSTLGYAHLVFATGARNRQLACPGAELPGVLGLRTLADAQQLQQALGRARQVVVIGAGFIGLEFAAAARARGLAVTVLEFAQRPMGRAVSTCLSDWFAQTHRDNGIDLRLGEGVREIRATGNSLVVGSSTGDEYDADLVVYGIGVLPNIELAQASGIHTENGITVDAALRTSAAGVYAIGDCAWFPNAFSGSRTRLESVQNATDQAKALAEVIATGSGEYAALPWFWSTQGALRLQIAGLAHPEDTPLVLGEMRAGKYSVALFRKGVLTAVESVNSPADHIAARKLLASRTEITPAMLREPGSTLKELAKRAVLIGA
ncbi:pyridine nucleotide-disulfide oxidoreductase [Arthrobacter sp. MYb229]|uniref:NAD(P)/FAD-dependent oxidoreductase n=1 Tax=unclassified Arthrobacter TaxID=235627 RepID=UPI000CFCB0D8|nr:MULTISPECIES: FAD-dependent oxidoreductase [unclassified Arthrobacter]PRA00918.1 pyridine nucleotide-disulfide oxidoreductase [Arthrobacter sp. MYb229]PRB48853.1 pyridine nucleotide-disulfide oxidoreductase [Arthrobacter sp. MYb216]